MYYINLVIGLLPPLVMLVIGIIWRRKPPARQSSGLAYRTALSERTQETWDFAHTHISRLWVRLGVVLSICTAILVHVWVKENFTLLLWVMANVTVGGATLLSHCAAFLDPFARLMGLDGVILMAFILGFPANEIVMPIVIMAYLSTGTLTELNDLSALHTLLVDHGWTWLTAVCTMLFSLFHWPCSTTCMTIKKESQSWKWTAVSMAVPTVCGLALCFLVNLACGGLAG